jgi:hypothetical protein
MHEWDVCIRMIPMIWKWDGMIWNGNRVSLNTRKQCKQWHNEARLLILILRPKATLLTQQLSKHNHDFISAHRGSQKEIMRGEFAAKLILWNYLCYLQFSATRIKLNLKRCSKHFHKSLENYQRQRHDN